MIGVPEVPADPLQFRDEKRYTDRLKDARAKTGRNDALSSAAAARRPAGDDRGAGLRLHGRLARHGGRRGASSRAMQTAVGQAPPFILFVASGGARMQEGILSLMQMPRITIAVDMLREARLPYIVVLTDPTTGGVTRLLCHARRRPDRRARRADRLRRSARDRADHPREAAGRLPARRISCSNTAWSTWSCIATSCARRCRISAAC